MALELTRVDVNSVYKPMQKRTDLPAVNAEMNVIRFRAGEKPVWMQEEEEKNKDETKSLQKEIEQTDRRLERLKTLNQDQTDATKKPRSRRFEPTIIEDREEHPEDEEEDENAYRKLTEDEKLSRRELLHKRLQVQPEITMQNLPELPQEIDADDEEGSEYTSESEYEEQIQFKPVYIPKESRELLRARDQKVEIEKLKEKEEQKRIELRKQQAHLLVVEELQKEITQPDQDLDNEFLIDDTDDIEGDYNDWVLRELKRIERDHLEREAYLKEKEETDRRRLLTDEERERDNFRLQQEGIREAKGPKVQWKFLQKYYHKGVFYLDESSVREKSDVRKKEYDLPTGQDEGNKEALPMIMQKRDFGKRSQTKWTHLKNEDTTNWDSPWFQQQSGEDIRKREKKSAGTKDLEVKKRKLE